MSGHDDDPAPRVPRGRTPRARDTTGGRSRRAAREPGRDRAAEPERDREGRHPEDWLVLTESYFDRRVYRDDIERDGLRMVFESRHWTLADYF
ncbi:MAG TPA: hypothetical protein VGD67_16915, partial [Pseudonocardiaceae bacterium]